MRTLVAAVLAVPVIATSYVPRSLRRSKAFRTLLLATLSLATAAALAPAMLGPVVSTAPSALSTDGAASAHLSATSDALAPLGAVEGIAVAAPALRFVEAAFRADATLARLGSAAQAPSSSTSSASGTTAAPAAPAVAPSVVRFRPRPGTTDVASTVPVSVRFTEAMSHAATQRAFSVVVAGRPVSGTYAWFEGSTVLVMTPKTRFPAGAPVTLSVSRSARSASGVALRSASSATFRVQPAAVATAKTTARATTTAKTSATTTSTLIKPAGSGLHAVELYYLSLMNCTRTGGWVGSSGTCTGAGTRDVKPLVLDAGISDAVSRPYALFLASRDICSHFADGNPGTRLSRAGYRNWDWAENIGCLSADPYRSMLLTHLFYQSEKPYDGGHYRNLMNPLYDRVGIGVEVVHGVLRLVIDFYRP